ncbi:MAG: FAD-dependent oxidoreductase [Candidatus Thermoplasmatota archaeon]|nr:FAD-dependent oxidoreductase [Candidatus Thermoplasmatota archaeon]
MDVVIIGFGTGAIGAVRTLLSNSREHNIVVVERRSFDTYSPCGMPYVVGGEVEEHSKLRHDFPPNPRLKKLLSHEALSIDREKKMVRVKNLGDSSEEDLTYSCLILDAGSGPFVPNISFEQGLLGRGIFTFTRPEDVDLLLSHLSSIKKVAVVGAGAIGLELAQSLHERGKEVVLIEMKENPLPGLFDPDMAGLVSKALPGAIATKFSSPLKEIVGKDRVEAVVAGEERMEVDSVVLSLGVVPETSLASAAGLETSRLGVVVDQHMRTSDPDIYAVGDCIQSQCGITGAPMGSRIAPPALRQGVVAAMNILGQEEAYAGSLGSFVTVVGGEQFASVGLNGRTEGLVSARVTLPSMPHYMGGKDVCLKLFAYDDGRVVGAQAAGPGAVELVNRTAVAIRGKMGLKDLVAVDYAYCPPVNDVFDPLALAAEAALKKISRRKR